LTALEVLCKYIFNSHVYFGLSTSQYYKIGFLEFVSVLLETFDDGYGQ